MTPVPGTSPREAVPRPGQGPPISRRRFIAGSVALGGAGAGALLAACGSGSPATPGPPATPNAWVAVSTTGLVAGEPRWVEFDLTGAAAGAADGSPAVPAGTPADSLPAARGGAWLVEEADGSIVAFVPNCPHQLCLYDWEASEARFRCRCHPGFFDVEGDVTGGPPPRPLWRYETRPAGPGAIEIGIVTKA